MTTAPQGDLVAQIHRLMADGHSDDDILQDLVGRGLSRPTAERFLAKAYDTPVATAVVPPTVAEAPPPVSSVSGRSPSADLYIGVSLLIVGAYLAGSEANVRPKLILSLVGGGAVAYLSGMWTCLTKVRPMPWKSMVATTLPIAAAIVWGVVLPAQRQAAAREEAAARVAQEAARIAREAADAQRVVADQARVAEVIAALEPHRKRLREGRHPGLECEAALAIGRSRMRQFIPDLDHAMVSADTRSVRVCAAAGLVEMGEAGRMTQVYVQWARTGDEELVRSAVTGLADIGPSAAEHAMPYLTRWAHQDEYYRGLAADSLAKLGPTGRPLLEQLANDDAQVVRTIARQGLR